MSGPCMPVGGVSGVPGAVLNPPAPLPCRTVTWPIEPIALPHTSPQSALARSASPSLLKSAATRSLGLVVLVGRVVPGEVNVTSAPAGAAASRNRNAAQAMACLTGPPGSRPLCLDEHGGEAGGVHHTTMPHAHGFVTTGDHRFFVAPRALPPSIAQ